MSNYFFHNNKLNNENIDMKISHNTNSLNQNINVDINKLLNRIKINEKKEKEQKFILFGITVSILGLMGIFIAFIK